MAFPRLAPRQGMTLPEVITAMVLMGIIGSAVTSVFITQSKLFDQQEKAGSARAVSRSAVNMMMSELRMLERGGTWVSATPSKIVVRAPYALGVVCSSPSGYVVFSRLPGDTMAFNYAMQHNTYSGFAYRVTGGYAYVGTTGNVQATTSPSCNTERIAVLTAPQGGGIFWVPSGSTTVPAGTPLLLLQNVSYEFKASTAVPGRIGLFRQVGSQPEEELVAPFAPTARFRFFISDGAAANDSPPGTLANITGLQLVLDGLSERPGADGTHAVLPLTTSVFFRNRL